MNILEFTKQFPTEKSCKEHFRAQGEAEGVNTAQVSSTIGSKLSGNGSVLNVVSVPH